MEEKKGSPITFRPKESTREALNKLAHEYDRSVSYVVERLIRDALKLD